MLEVHFDFSAKLKLQKQSFETQVTMLQCTTAGGRTKGANGRSFVFVNQHGGDDVTWKPDICACFPPHTEILDRETSHLVLY